MAISKVIYKSSSSATPATWMDATTATAAAADIIAPKTAMLADGVVTEGTGTSGYTPQEIATAQVSGDITITGDVIKYGAFWGNNGITSVTANDVTTLRESCLRGLGACTISVPKVTTCEANVFNGTNANIYMPLITSITGNQYANAGGSGKYLALPALTSMASDGLRGCNWTILDLGFITSIPTRGIYQGSAKTVVILRYTGDVVTATATNAIYQINSSTTVYVPSALISSYQTAPGWSSKGCTFSSLEDSIYKNTTWPVD